MIRASTIFPGIFPRGPGLSLIYIGHSLPRLQARNRPKQICSVWSRAAPLLNHTPFLRLPVSLLPGGVNRMRSLVSGNDGKERRAGRILRWVRRLSPTSFKRTRASRLAEMFLKEIRRVVCFVLVSTELLLPVQSVTLVEKRFFLFSFSPFLPSFFPSLFLKDVEQVLSSQA